jgi:hypothetical protein
MANAAPVSTCMAARSTPEEVSVAADRVPSRGDRSSLSDVFAVHDVMLARPQSTKELTLSSSACHELSDYACRF